jgi:hypothetical protein
MQFGRESGNFARRADGSRASPPAVMADAKGWVCSKDPAHFRKGD